MLRKRPNPALKRDATEARRPLKLYVYIYGISEC